MKTMIILMMMILTTVTATVSAQNILMASHTYTGKGEGEGLSIIPEDEIQNEFMVEMKQREGYFMFQGDLFPPAPKDIIEMPVEMQTFEFMGERYLNDPDQYLVK